MQKPGTFKTKLTFKELQELCRLYAWQIGDYAAFNEHEYLLQEHMISMLWKLQRRWNGMFQKKYTITFTATEALAFFQVWQMVDISDRPLSLVITCRVIGEMDLFIKNLQREPEQLLIETA